MKRSDHSIQGDGSAGEGDDGDQKPEGVVDMVDRNFDDAQEEDIQDHKPDEESMIFAVAAHDPEQWPNVILRGRAADLSALRQVEAHSTFFVGPRKLHGSGIPCKIYHQGQDDTASVGGVFITESQVLFVSGGGAGGTSTEPATAINPEEDWAIGATCIHLHAMTDEPETSVYLQLHEAGSGDDDATLEVTIIPVDPEACQALFDGLCKLVSRHPLQLDDDDGDGAGGSGFGGGNFFMGGGDDNDMIWAPSAGFGAVIPDEDEDDEDGGANEAERAAMLERLDNMLVVRPELESEEGQFDDAEEMRQ